MKRLFDGDLLDVKYMLLVLLKRTKPALTLEKKKEFNKHSK